LDGLIEIIDLVDDDDGGVGVGVIHPNGVGIRHSLSLEKKIDGFVSHHCHLGISQSSLAFFYYQQQRL